MGTDLIPFVTLSYAYLLSYEMAWTQSTGAQKLSEHNIHFTFELLFSPLQGHVVYFIVVLVQMKLDNKQILSLQYIQKANKHRKRQISLIRTLAFFLAMHSSDFDCQCSSQYLLQAELRGMLYCTENFSIFLFNVTKISLYQK